LGVSASSEGGSGWISEAEKSQKRAERRLDESVELKHRRMFAGLMSAWMTCEEWRKSRPEISWLASVRK